MIPEWYFCNCINSSPKTTEAFLSALETLDNPESSFRLRHISLYELQKMSAWMQIYAIPWLLNLRIQNRSNSILDEEIKNYFHGLIELVPEEISNEFIHLNEIVFFNSEQNSELFKGLEESSKSCVSIHDRTLSPIPYIDLKDFFAETFILYIALDNCLRRQNHISVVSQLLSNRESYFTQLFQNALDGQYGRKALRVAIQITCYTQTDYTKERLLSFVWNSPNTEGHFEPDILQSTAEILFLNQESRDSIRVQETIKSIQTEIKELRWLRKLTRSKNFSYKKSFGLMNIIPIDDREVCLPIIFWHGILWEISVHVDTVKTSAELANLWCPPKSFPSKSLAIKSHFDGANSDKWIRQLESLLTLQFETQEIHSLQATKSAINERFIWSFFSPWVVFGEKDPKSRNKNEVIYENALKHEVLIRLCSAVYISSLILQKLPPDNPHRSVFTALLAHGHSVIGKFKQWLLNFDRDDYDFGATSILNLPLTGLVLFARRQIQIVGTGKLKSVTPEEFVCIFDEQSYFQSAGGSYAEKTLFVNTVLPEVLFDWIEAAYPSVIDSNASGRWLENHLINKIYERFKLIHQAQPHQPFVPHLVVRFLSDGYHCKRELDWRYSKNNFNKINGWKVHPRQLLLTNPDLGWSEWNLNSERWSEPDWENFKSPNKLGTQIVRCMERISSLKNSDYDTPPASIAEDWVGEFFRLISSINETQEMDRFVRLRLIELIDDLVLKNEPDIQELIGLLILEFGCVYDIVQLSNRVFFNEKSKQPNSTRLSLQLSLYKAMKNQLRLEIVKLKQLKSAQDPRISDIENQKSVLIEITLARIIYSCSISPYLAKFSEAVDRDLGRAIEIENEHHKTRVRFVKTDVVTDNGKNVILNSPNNLRIEDWSVRAIVNNPNTGKAIVFFEDIDLSGPKNLKNLFENPELANLFKDYEVHRVLSRLIDIKQDNNRVKLTFTCGLKQLISGEFEEQKINSAGISINDYISLPIYWQYKGEGKWKSWLIDRKASNNLEVLKFNYRPNDQRQLFVTEDFNSAGNLPRKFFVNCNNTKERIEVDDKRVWYPDFSRSFRKINQKTSYAVSAKLDKDGNWSPLDLDFLDLLLKAKILGLPRFTLTFIEETVKGFGEIYWRFSRIPGENYLIPRTCFVLEDAERIDFEISKIDKAGGAFGLIISFEIAFEIKGVALRLTDKIFSNELMNEFIEDLRSPFDYRNIEWRMLFNNSEKHIANKHTGRWYYNLDDGLASGYPRQVKIEWDRYTPRQSENSAEFIANDWSINNEYRKRFVSGVAIWQNKINLRDGELNTFVDKILNLKKKDRFTLKSAIGKISPRNDFIPYLTVENIRINVTAESLNMLPMAEYSIPNFGDGQEVEVISISSSKNFEIISDFNDLPDQVIEDSDVVGVIISTPNWGEGEVCKVAWKTKNGVYVQENFRVENQEQLKFNIYPGCKVFASASNAGWHFYASPLSVRARALWTLGSLTDSQSVVYLGTIHGETPQELFQIAPGKIGFLSLPRIKRHLYCEKAGETSTTINSNFVIESKSNYNKRVVLKSNGFSLSGICYYQYISGQVVIDDVRMKCIALEDDFYYLEREFELSQAVIRNDRIDKQTDNAELTEKIEAYFQNETNLAATVNQKNGRLGVFLNDLKVPSNLSQTSWTTWVEIGVGEAHYVDSARYKEQAVVRLYKENDRIFASFRRVPPITLQQFFINLGARTNESIKLREVLHYVGPNKFDEFTGKEFDEIYHHFEMGYGETLLIPASTLRYNGGNFDQFQFILFYGDKISNITFLAASNQERVEEETGQSGATSQQYIININEFKYSQSHLLFNQRQTYKVIHLLHVIPSDDRIIVKFIEGFNEEALSDELGSYKRLTANLDSASEERLLGRLSDTDKFNEKEVLILGRLDNNRFKESFGKDLFFQHVQLSFEKSDVNDSVLQDGERIFLRAGKIHELENDTGLYLQAPHGLETSDIGNDFWEKKDRITKKWVPAVRVLRRRFSVRENFLNRVLEQRGENELKDRLFLVKIKKSTDSRVVISTIIDGAPSRKDSALSGKISKEGVLFATIAEFSTNHIKLEITPGIFVTIESKKIKSDSSSLEKGSVVRLENFQPTDSDDLCRFILLDAAFSDRKYLTSPLRPAVAFPTNILLKEAIFESYDVEKNEFWANIDHFTIGGLPNIRATPGSYNIELGEWKKPDANKLINLMETPHPKLVNVGIDAKNDFRFEPLERNHCAGSIQFDEDNLKLYFIPLKKDVSKTDMKELYWHNLTFCDDSVAGIVSRLREEVWDYHDKSSAYWGPKNTIERKPPEIHNAMTGPLFFDISRHNQYRLRYYQGHFQKFGFPVQELFQSLKSSNDGKWYSVAGRRKDGGLWVEIIPGRIVEIPTNLFIFKSKSQKDISLAEMDWNAFSSGDRILIRMASADSFKVDYIELIDWHMGPRKAFGSELSVTFLPVEKVDKNEGALIIGSGSFKLKIPMTNPSSDWKTVALTSNNEIFDVSDKTDSDKRTPHERDVILLGNSNNGVIIIGLEEFTPVPVNDEKKWKFDPLADWVRSNLICDLIKTAHGALPVTVEKIDRRNKTIYYSRYHQLKALSISGAKFSLAKVSGLLKNRVVILRCGSGLVNLSVNRIVSGLPEACFAAAISLLKELKTSIWVRKNGNEFLTGLSDETKSEIMVEPVGFIQNSTKQISGLICRAIGSLALFWLPQKDASWVQMPFGQFKRIFSKKETFKVRLSKESRGTSRVSVVDVFEVKKEFTQLEVGKEIAIRIVEPLESETTENNVPNRFLAESYNSKVLLLLETNADDIGERVVIPSEVIVRNENQPKSVIVTLLGKRPYNIDLPYWINELRGSGKNRSEMNDYLEWRRATTPFSDFLNVAVADADDNVLKEILCRAYDTLEKDELYCQKQVEVALNWIKRAEFSKEVFLPYSIMAILILHKFSSQPIKKVVNLFNTTNQDDIRGITKSWNWDALSATIDIGQRALRSSHIETLGERWFFNRREFQPRDLIGLHYRLDKMIKYIKHPLDIKRLRFIKQFCYAIEIREVKEMKYISKALLASLGELEDITMLQESTENKIVLSLIDIYKSIPIKTSRLDPFIGKRLKDLLNKITRNGTDITLLDKLPIKNMR
jgi:hypothetical protein